MKSTARIVAAFTLPLEATGIGALADRIVSQFGPGLTIDQELGRLVFRSPGEVCGCRFCLNRDEQDLARLTGDPWIALTRGMIICSDCGHKRCPKATHHENECTSSNEPGQEGSAYA